MKSYGVTIPLYYPCEWGEPGTGEHRLLRLFQTERLAQAWINAGCPGTLKVRCATERPEGWEWGDFHPGWNAISASPDETFLTRGQAMALCWQSQDRKFDYFRANAKITDKVDGEWFPGMEDRPWGIEPIYPPCMPRSVEDAWDALYTARRRRATPTDHQDEKPGLSPAGE